MQVVDIESNAHFILLVEKDAAFMRLAEDRFYNTYPCIILTAKGQPDVATRQAVSSLLVYQCCVHGWPAQVVPILPQKCYGLSSCLHKLWHP